MTDRTTRTETNGGKAKMDDLSKSFLPITVVASVVGIALVGGIAYGQMKGDISHTQEEVQGLKVQVNTIPEIRADIKYIISIIESKP